ncbi:methylenetetrahydrofolate reductase C-terminal domain-containing protein [Demequina sp. NBRC 110055]|uniref:methylenetetrahydrofolate reductase C-terminal domain-containing protein n=1 Tax=Demequina sp. NBRC 110055 TaxID=1570344 RepID=UPI0021011AD2|nr:methylenetetrahydrofolate reductase C-terminal domain-containing protein [Demequina sp. NBRC 110055]
MLGELPAPPAPGTAGCPKHMEYGPCGGVGSTGRCEVADHACSFLTLAPVAWHGSPAASDEHARMEADPAGAPSPPRAAQRLRDLMREHPIVVADFPARALDGASLAECAAAVAGSVDAVLAGDAGTARVQFPPAYRATLLRHAGVEPWMGVNARDRNRVALEGEAAALAHADAAGVHCITGDHTRIGSRPDAAPVFDLDSTELAALMAGAGHLVSVAEAPLSPPVDARPGRLLVKQQAGAEVCFVNHAGGAANVATFVGQARALGVSLGFIPCVPVIVDAGSAALIRGFTSLALPEGYLDVILAAKDVRAAGIRAAIDLSLRMLDIPGVVGVDLSGGAAAGRELDFARAEAEIAQGIRERVS